MAWKARVTNLRLDPVIRDTIIEVGFYDDAVTSDPEPGDFLWSTSYASALFQSVAELGSRVTADGQAARAVYDRSKQVAEAVPVGTEISIP